MVRGGSDRQCLNRCVSPKLLVQAFPPFPLINWIGEGILICLSSFWVTAEVKLSGGFQKATFLLSVTLFKINKLQNMSQRGEEIHTMCQSLAYFFRLPPGVRRLRREDGRVNLYTGKERSALHARVKDKMRQLLCQLRRVKQHLDEYLMARDRE